MQEASEYASEECHKEIAFLKKSDFSQIKTSWEARQLNFQA